MIVVVAQYAIVRVREEATSLWDDAKKPAVLVTESQLPFLVTLASVPTSLLNVLMPCFMENSVHFALELNFFCLE